MKPNWTAIIMTSLTVFVGLACAAIALTLGKDNATASGTLLAVAGAAFGSFLKQPHAYGDDTQPRQTQAGHVMPAAVFLLLFSTLAVAAVLLFTVAARADSNDPATGGCVAKNADGTCKASYQLSMQAPMVALNLKTGDAFYGANAVALGPCYGFTYQPSLWYASGVDACVAFRVAPSQPNQYIGALMFHVLKFGSVGVGTQGTQEPGGMVWQGLLFLSPRLPLQ